MGQQRGPMPSAAPTSAILPFTPSTGNSTRTIVPLSPSTTTANSSTRTTVTTDGKLMQVFDAKTGRQYRVRVATTNIESCVRFSYWRCIVSIISIALVLTDIPRTGLSLSLDTFYARAAAGVYWSYGPYAYPTIHINRSSTTTATLSNATTTSYVGMKKGKPVTSAMVWAYKFDTLSTSQRAIAEHLAVASYPACILYKEPCPLPTLDLETTFGMIDGWVQAMVTHYFSLPNRDRGLPVTFLTRSNWMDRLHHVLLRYLWRRQDTRIHTVHYYPSLPNRTRHSHVCTDPMESHLSFPKQRKDRRVLRPWVCDISFKWRLKHPSPPPAPAPVPPTVAIPQHIDLRVAMLQRQYPDLQLDLTVITTKSSISSEPFHSKLPIIFYSTENLEMTTWIRGRRCQSPQPTSDCETVFVDDYRYEGSTLTTDADDWRWITGGLRAVAQGFIWVRFLLLCWSCYRARSDEAKYRDKPLWRRLWATLATMSRIPGHVIVYGSWVPVVCYTAAHTIDSGLMHLISNSVWSSIDGLFEFHLVAYVQSASVQMRNVWMLALFWKLVMVAFTNSHGKPRGDAWVPRTGVLAARGIFISLSSWLTIFSFLRALRFRDVDIISFTELPRHVPFNALRSTPTYTNVADFGYRLDIKTTVTVTLVVSVVMQVLQYFVKIATGQPTRFFFCRTYYIPYSADFLWPRSMLNMFWHFRLVKSVGHKKSSMVALRSLFAMTQQTWRLPFLALNNAVRPTPHHSAHPRCVVCSRTQSIIHWRAAQGCVNHDKIFRVATRPKEIASMMRLLNLTLLSDPLVFCQLYVFGQSLSLCRFDASCAATTKSTSDAWASGKVDADADITMAFLLPTASVYRRDQEQSLVCIATIDSREVPWGVLVGCG